MMEPIPHLRPQPAPRSTNRRQAMADAVRTWAEDGGRLVSGDLSWTGATLVEWALYQAPETNVPGDAGVALRLFRSALAATREVLSDLVAVDGDEGPAGFWIASSGTTGRPRPVFWTWDALLTGVETSSPDRRATVCLHYPAASFAGVQGLLHGVVNGRDIHLSPQGPTRAGRETDIHLLGTPSFFRIHLSALKDICPTDRIMLIATGGEPIPQSLLDALLAMAPAGRISHVFATSEHGSLFSVSDGRAGFPASLLGRRLRNGKMLQVVAGALVVQQGGETSATGDLVRVEGDRVLFIGRSGRTVSVAGQVVDLSQIEACLAGSAEVFALRVEGRPSGATGSVLIAHVQPSPDADVSHVETRLRTAAEAGLPYVARPRRYVFHERLPVADSGKLPLAVEGGMDL